MPFGAKPAPEEFQRRIDFADDNLVFGVGGTDVEELEDHDRNLKEMLICCRQKGIKLNSAKIQLRQTHVNYMGHIIPSEGHGMVNYIQKFAPNLADYFGIWVVRALDANLV